MKRLLLIGLLVLASTISQAQAKKDAQTIKSMCGCYEVQFEFAETFSYPQKGTEYKPSETKYESALEWITPIEATENRISLQHLLIVTDQMVIKHWRQDWTFEDQNIWHYNGFNGVDYTPKTEHQIKGQWAQQVFGVDETPRYMESATWVYVDGKAYWKNTVDAPLPRREYTKRSDYNILERTNTHEITATGWIHNQDNSKIIRTKGADDYILAKEKGLNTYTKVDDSRCLAAQKYWNEHEKLWAKVRYKWTVEANKKKNINYHKAVDGKPLYSYLFALSADATQQQVNTIIDRFIIR